MSGKLFSIESIYKIGSGPSSSHTIGPFRALKSFIHHLNEDNINYDFIHITLYGSLALTGVGHHTDRILYRALGEIKGEVVFDKTVKPSHPNTMYIEAFKNNKSVRKYRYISIGGGDLEGDDETVKTVKVYPFATFSELTDYIINNHFKNIPELVKSFESGTLDEHLDLVIDTMISTIQNGLELEGNLIRVEGLIVNRRAKQLYTDALNHDNNEDIQDHLLASYAMAMNEQSVCGDLVVTSPTCGSCGVLASLVAYEILNNKRSRKEVKEALMTAGMIGNLVKLNATVAGAVGGCQAEIGTASAMGAAFLCQLDNAPLVTIDYASSSALQHFFGLTCDPVKGYPVLPCVERNAIGALHSKMAYSIAKILSQHGPSDVPFDLAVKVMKETGDAMNRDYKETSLGGLAKYFGERC